MLAPSVTVVPAIPDRVTMVSSPLAAAMFRLPVPLIDTLLESTIEPAPDSARLPPLIVVTPV